MQSIDHLVDAFALHISQRHNSPGIFWFSEIDLKFVYSQIPLDVTIAKHCNFSILGGRATGIYRFLNGFYGLTDMPATFQKTIDKTLEGISSNFAFLDDILVITISLQKCEFAKNRIHYNSQENYPTGNKNRSNNEIR